MHDHAIEAIRSWLVAGGLAGLSESDLLHGFCARCREAGLPLGRGLTLVDTLHPIWEGRAFRWREDPVDQDPMVEYGRTDAGEAADNWRRSVFYRLLETGADELRLRLDPNEPPEFGQMQELAAEGHTECVAFVHRCDHAGAIGGLDCVYSNWSTRHPQGFCDADLEALRRLLPSLALAVKSASLARIAQTLVHVYLGRDTGQRVLGGRIRRGVADKIAAVLWFSDLRGFTAITDGAPPEEVIPLLNDYADAVISSIHAAGGEVLKLIGDGTLAIFHVEDDAGDACRRALRAEAGLRRRLEELNARRAAEGRATTTVYLGLHVGDVFYGNVGSDDRLDFTVVGPAVNETSRIGSLCRSVDREVLTSEAFREQTPEPERAALVSVGRYALRGVGRAQALYTLDPTVEPLA